MKNEVEIDTKSGMRKRRGGGKKETHKKREKWKNA